MASNPHNWIPISSLRPTPGVVVETKTDDKNGCRNERHLKLGGLNGNLWFIPDGSMYVYYEPTHWRPIA